MSEDPRRQRTGLVCAGVLAVRFQREATICVSNNTQAAVPTCTASTDWSQGWMVWVDKDRDGATSADEVVSVFAPLSDTLPPSAICSHR